MAYRFKEDKIAHDRNKADHKRRVLARWKRAKGCVDCGYDENSDALEFDHKPGTKGSKTVASMLYSSWKLIKAELSKCEVRCANCHAIKTFERKRLSAAGGTADTVALEATGRKLMGVQISRGGPNEEDLHHIAESAQRASAN